MDKLFQTAIAELGEKGVAGADNHNERILKYANEAGFHWINDDETPWCSIFMNWVAMKAGLERSKQLNARLWLLTGKIVDQAPEPGDVVIFWREQPDSWKGHVGIFIGYSASGTRIYSLGGNQGNQVSITGYPQNTLLGFRRLRPEKGISIPDVQLQRGNTGDNVKALQDALKVIGINCGTSDGVFGERTEKGVKTLQSMKIGLNVDGKFGRLTREYLLEVLENRREVVTV